MMLLLLILIILFLVGRRERVDPDGLVETMSTIDNRAYLVLRANNLAAANALARLRINVERVVERALNNSTSDNRYHEPTVLLTTRLHKHGLNLVELNPEKEDAIAINKNKGEIVFICMRREPPFDMSVSSDDILLFIALHEMAHAMNVAYAPMRNGHSVHDKEFRENEAFLMRAAKQLGLLDPSVVPGRTHCRYQMPNPSAAP